MHPAPCIHVTELIPAHLDDIDRRMAELATTHEALRVRGVISPRNRITVVLGLGCGLRQGEVFGVSPEDTDCARGVLHVRRQVQAINGKLHFTLPKGAKTRTVDMPSAVAEELKRHAEMFPPVEVELSWGRRRRKTASTYRVTPVPRSCWRRGVRGDVGAMARALLAGHHARLLTHFRSEAGSEGRTVIDGLLGEQGDRCVGRNSPDSPQG